MKIGRREQQKKRKTIVGGKDVFRKVRLERMKCDRNRDRKRK